MYTSEDYRDDFIVSVFMQMYLEEMFHTYQVDLALWGHYHAYERTCAVYHNECTRDGTVNIVIGTAGYELDNVAWYNVTWSLNHIYAFGYGVITTQTDPLEQFTELKIQFFLNSDDSMFDEKVLVKELPSD